MVSPLLNRSSEAYTGYIGVIGSDHAYIHQGLAFTSIINTGSISSIYKISFKTPSVADSLWVHWRPTGVTSSADYVELEIYEGDAFTGGTSVTPINRNRNSTTSSAMQAFYKGTTVTLAGTIVESAGVGSAGGFFSSSGGAASADQELVLKANTNYTIAITPAGTTTCIFELFWYEEGRGA